MLFLWLLTPCVALSVTYALFWWSGRRARKLFKGLPSYTPLPFIGNSHQVFGDGKFLVTVANDVSKIMDNAGQPFVAWMGPKPIIVLHDPEDVKAVTFAFVDKPYYYNFARDWVGNGLVTAPGCIWKHSIKKLAGTFTGNTVEGYQDIFNAQAQKLVDKLKKEVGKPIDILHGYLAYTTLETICQTALGVPSSISDTIVTHEYYRAFNRTFQLFIARGMNLFLHLDWVYRLTPAYKELMRNVAVLHNVSETVIKKRLKEREEMKQNGTLPSTDSENGKSRLKTYLDILFDLRDADPTMSLTQIRNEVDTIIVGGQETVATTLFMTLLEIGSKTDIQEKMYAEIKEIFGDSKRPVQKADLVRMTYTEASINETLRMYPPIPGVMRYADRDLQIKSCTIPKGTGCVMNLWGAGRSKRTWGSDAEEYRPERWLENEDLCRTNSANLLAFSCGKRACIGRRYAMPVLKTMLAYIVRDLEVHSTLDQVEFKFDVSLKAVSGHLITLALRENMKYSYSN